MQGTEVEEIVKWNAALERLDRMTGLRVGLSNSREDWAQVLNCRPENIETAVANRSQGLLRLRWQER